MGIHSLDGAILIDRSLWVLVNTMKGIAGSRPCQQDELHIQLLLSNNELTCTGQSQNSIFFQNTKQIPHVMFLLGWSTMACFVFLSLTGIFACYLTLFVPHSANNLHVCKPRNPGLLKYVETRLASYPCCWLCVESCLVHLTYILDWSFFLLNNQVPIPVKSPKCFVRNILLHCFDKIT